MADQVIVRFAQMQAAFDRDPARYHEAIERGATEAANGDPNLKAKYLASWNNAMNLLRMEDTGTTVMAAAQDDVASRIQTALVDSAIADNRLQSIRGGRADRLGAKSVELFEVKFDNDDWFGWLSMAWKLIF